MNELIQGWSYDLYKWIRIAALREDPYNEDWETGWRPEPYEDSFRAWLSKVIDGFEEYILDAFNAVTTPLAYLSFRRDFLSDNYSLGSLWGPCIQVGKYDEAEDYLFNIYESEFREIVKTKAILEAKDWRPDTIDPETFYKNRIRRLELWSADTLRAFEAVCDRDYVACQAIVDECIDDNERRLKLALKDKWDCFS